MRVCLLQAADFQAPDDPLTAAEAKLGVGMRQALQSLGCQAPSGPTLLLQSLLAFLLAAHGCEPSSWAAPTPIHSKAHPAHLPRKLPQQLAPAGRPMSHQKLLQQPSTGAPCCVSDPAHYDIGSTTKVSAKRMHAEVCLLKNKMPAEV